MIGSMSFGLSAIWPVTLPWRNPNAGIGSENCRPVFLPETMLPPSMPRRMRNDSFGHPHHNSKRQSFASMAPFPARVHGIPLFRPPALVLSGSFSNQDHLEALAEHYRQLEVWAKNCPENFGNRASLVAGEIARLEGRDFEAMSLYEEAIRLAHQTALSTMKRSLTNSLHASI